MNFSGARRAATLVALGALLIGSAVAPGAALAAQSARTSQPGAPGIGDPYFPRDGNGGYDVKHYLLDLRYDPATDVLSGTAIITARATQDLSAFNLDLDGMTVRSVRVNTRQAAWNRDDAELAISPQSGIKNHSLFVTKIRYDGIPQTINDQLGSSGFFHTDDGSLVIGQPHVASTWYPVNDHPLDKASYTFLMTVPQGLQVVANGRLIQDRTRGGLTTWAWHQSEPMASYLATASVGQWEFNEYSNGGIRYLDALDPDLLDPVAEPRTGDNFAWSQRADSSYKRLTRTVSVPADGGQLSFWVTRDTEPDWDFVFVEAHTAGGEDWTTLPDLHGHTSAATGNSCPFWQELHPFLAHYQTGDGAGGCTPAGSSGVWWAASGASDGWEQWTADLGAYAGTDVELSISYASDEAVQTPGVFVDDVVLPGGVGSTSFENDGDTFDGWTVSGPPEGSPGNENDWIAAVEGGPSRGDIAQASFAREPEIIGFLESYFGKYPFKNAGGIVDDLAGVGFALENQSRPIYSQDFFTDPFEADSVVVHELAHQWTGDNLAVESWQHIWLNEGFATYTEWLWSESQGLGTVQEIFDFYVGIPADDSFWSLVIGDPGPDAMFDFPVYARGAMTLQALRQAVGDDTFFQILKQWASQKAGNVSTAEFIALAEEVSGQELSPLFDEWLFTGVKPAGLGEAALKAAPTGASMPPAIANLERAHKTGTAY